MTSPAGLQYNRYYHIYNRGNNRETIFVEERNYTYFLTLYAHYISPLADTYAYCLLRNHFHLLVRIKADEEIQAVRAKDEKVAAAPGQQFGNFFNAYAKSFNKTYERSGSLFQNPFGRVEVISQSHLTYLVRYIHLNPERHEFVKDFRQWPYSSYSALISDKPTRLQRQATLGWFDGQRGFTDAHGQSVDLHPIAYLMLDE